MPGKNREMFAWILLLGNYFFWPKQGRNREANQQEQNYYNLENNYKSRARLEKYSGEKLESDDTGAMT